MRSIFGTPIGWRPTRPALGYSGSINASSLAHGTTCSISARNFSRRVMRFLRENSYEAKLICCGVGLRFGMVDIMPT
jgi:hypothetical protein